MSGNVRCFAQVSIWTGYRDPLRRPRGIQIEGHLDVSVRILSHPLRNQHVACPGCRPARPRCPEGSTVVVRSKAALTERRDAQ